MKTPRTRGMKFKETGEAMSTEVKDRSSETERKVSGLTGRVLVCSGGRYESQANAQIRESIMDGWGECFGEENVTAVHISAAEASIKILKPKIVFAIG